MVVLQVSPSEPQTEPPSTPPESLVIPTLPQTAPVYNYLAPQPAYSVQPNQVMPAPAALPVMPVKANETPVTQPKTPVKLSVANVRKETALLFTMADDGKLTFVQKVPAGEAVDVQTTSGQRWTEIYTDNPAAEYYTAATGRRRLAAPSGAAEMALPWELQLTGLLPNPSKPRGEALRASGLNNKAPY